jgi:lipoprotein-releasing system ATP-binding protein
LLGGLDFPSSGAINVLGKNWQKLSEKERCLWRNKTLGFVYQFHHLLPEFTALENTMLPLMLQSLSKAEIGDRALYLLQRLGLEQRLHHRPHQLSGGERQRVAIARAMVAKPHCILADEPTGNLDNATADIVLNLWDELNREQNMALIIVTHDVNIAKRMDRSLQLINGKLGEVKW